MLLQLASIKANWSSTFSPAVALSWGSAHFGILKESKGGQIPSFLFNPLCDDGNALSRFNKISRYYFQTTECKLTACLTAETNESVIGRGLCAVTCAVWRQKKFQPYNVIVLKNTRIVLNFIVEGFLFLFPCCVTYYYFKSIQGYF